jgi:hypothetical protein
MSAVGAPKDSNGATGSERACRFELDTDSTRTRRNHSPSIDDCAAQACEVERPAQVKLGLGADDSHTHANKLTTENHPRGALVCDSSVEGVPGSFEA